MTRCTAITALTAALVAVSAGAEVWAADGSKADGLVEAASEVLSDRLGAQTDKFTLRPVGGAAGSPCVTGSTEILDSMILTPEIATRMAVRTQVRCSGSERLRSATQWFAVSAMTKVPVLRRDIPEHAVLQATDVVWETRDIAELRGTAPKSGFLHSPVRARVPLRSGQPILADQLEPKPEVVAGSSVRAVYQAYGATLQFTAVALDDAYAGHALRIERPGATGLLHARATGNSKVEVIQ